MKARIIIILLLISFGFVLSKNSSAQKSKIDSLKQQLTISSSDTNKVILLNNIAWNYQRVNLDSSLFYADKALVLGQKLHYKRGIASAYYYIASVYLYKGNYALAIINLNKQLPIEKEINNKKGEANCYTTLGYIYIYQRNLDTALVLYNKSLQLHQQLNYDKGIASDYGNIGLINVFKGNYSEAINNYEDAEAGFKSIGDKNGLANIYLRIGGLYSYKGELDKAFLKLNQALIIFEEQNDKRRMAACYTNIGIIYKKQGNYEKAKNNFMKSLSIAKESGDKRSMSSSYNNLGVVFDKMHEDSLAIANFKKSLEIKLELGEKSSVSSIYYNIGSIYNNKDSLEESLKWFNKSLEIYKDAGDKQGVARVYSTISYVYIQLYDVINDTLKKHQIINSAISYAKKAKEINKELLIRSTSEYQQLARCYWALGDDNKAVNNFDTLIEIDNRNILMNFSFISEKERAVYFSTIAHDYWTFNSFALESKEIDPSIIESVYNNTIKNKGLLLKSNTALYNAVISSKDTSLINDYQKWILLRKQIASDYSRGLDTKDIEIKANEIEGQLVLKSQEFSDFAQIQKISWKDVQANLKNNEVAIEFTHFNLMLADSGFSDFTNQVQYAALLVTKHSKYPEMIPLFEEKQLEEIIGKFGGNNYNYINKIYGGKNIKTIQESSLYNLIWAPIDNYLDSIGMNSSNTNAKTKVYISPDGLLHKISFPAIAKKQDIYLCDAYDIEMKSTTGKIASSGSVKTIHESSQPTTATLFGGVNYDTDSTTYQAWKYLEGTQSETKKIDKILKKGKVKVNYYTNTTATEEEFKQMASNSNIIHIATHGFFYPDPDEVEQEKDTAEVVEEIVFRGGSRGFGVNSFVENTNPLMRSGLVFAGANDVWSKDNKNDSIDDGVLTAQEVSTIDMRKTQLVVMSACETGLGDIKGSEGVYGLQRAFKMAGVNYMIMSLWQVPDKETEEFMTKFYKKLIKTKDIKQSFAETQKEMRKKYDPYFWAAFVLIE